VLVSITCVLVSITFVGEYDMCWLVLYVLVCIKYVLVSITCVGEYDMCW
jgi:hypothetical protein